MTSLRSLSFAMALGLLVVATASPESSLAAPQDSASPRFVELVEADKPAVWWRFESAENGRIANAAEEGRALRLEGGAKLTEAGPASPDYPRMPKTNGALEINGRGYARATGGEGEASLAFEQGDEITIEAWVRLDAVAQNQQVYIVGKGRTGNAGFGAENQNWALRLRGEAGTARLSFLFRSVDGGEKGESAWHRWNSSAGFSPGPRWRHVAVSYQFGKPDSIRGYLDGEPSGGSWDYAGATKSPPVVDDDEVWVGSAMGGSANSTFRGRIDEVAVYRALLPAERFAARYESNVQPPKLTWDEVPTGAVQVEIIEGVPDRQWALHVDPEAETYQARAFAFVGVPRKYTKEGLIGDRSAPFLIRARSKRQFAAGRYEFLLRSLNGARLYVDGKMIAQNNFLKPNGSGHEKVPELPTADRPGLRPAAPGHQEQLVAVDLSEGEHRIRLEAFVGGAKLRPEVGELLAAAAPVGGAFSVLTAGGEFPLTDAAWKRFAIEQQAALTKATDAARRAAESEEVRQYWSARREYARRIGGEIEVAPPAKTDLPANNDIDRYINAGLVAAGVEPAELTADLQFLRRATLDTTGVIPTTAEIEQFLADPPDKRRELAIDRLLDDPRWADHWTPYWQDVLAENPGILKPKLNNTGPFRFWIHDSLRDNKPMDRFVTELVEMRGSKYYGGPAGFEMATQNDVPSAAKAHIVAQAFLAVEMKCARCHDAPYHPYEQKQLFQMAALLNRKPVTLPKSSTVPLGEGGRKPLVEITLKAGATIKPAWPFDDVAKPLPDDLIRSPGDSREQLAARLTSPHNLRFAKVLANRLWRRMLGRGLVDPVDDWHEAEPSQPELLDYLAQQLIASGYDFKHVARLILNSRTYQREVRPVDSQDRDRRTLFASPARRRLTAEQLVDSLFVAAGKPFRAEALTLDPEGRRPVDVFMNMGRPQRAWEFVTLSNERDRPALALPVAQSMIDLLQAYGWRQSRQSPLTVRESAPNMLQPMALAGGVVGQRIAGLSDDSDLTELALEEQPLDKLIERTVRRLLTRPPTEEERLMFGELLAPGYEERVKQPKATAGAKPSQRNAVSWSNHLSAEATRIKLELERQAWNGDPPTQRLDADWRKRMEDVVWVLINSPEFVFAP